MSEPTPQPGRQPDTPLMRDAGIPVPLICGAMYPCSNAELVAAVSDAGGLGIVQPISLSFVHGRPLREGLRFIRTLTRAPIGFNALIESSSRTYHERMVQWVDIALEEGVRFFVTSLGKPRWVVDAVHVAGGVVYHDVTERRWALKGRDSGVDGLIAVNARAGGHAGALGAEALLAEVADIGLPVVCAGGVGNSAEFAAALAMGYAGVQMGTRFIATHECSAHPRYKQAILEAVESDVVLTERLTGLPVAVLNTPYVQRLGLRAGPISRRLLRHPRTKRWMRSWYGLSSLWRLRRASRKGETSRDYWQAGRSVESIHDIVRASTVVDACARAAGFTANCTNATAGVREA